MVLMRWGSAVERSGCCGQSCVWGVVRCKRVLGEIGWAPVRDFYVATYKSLERKFCLDCGVTSEGISGI